MVSKVKALADRTPTLGLLLFLLHPAAVMLNPDLPWLDPGSGWHLACGRIMIGAGELIRSDPFSFSEAGRAWLMNDWLFFVWMGALERVGGLPLIAAASAVIYGLVPFVLYRRMLRGGVGAGPAFGCALLAYLVLLMHGMARPHGFTYLFFAILLGMLDRAMAGDPPRRAALKIAAMMVLWVNLHGGFAIGLVACGVYFLVAAGRWAVDRTDGNALMARGMFGICAAAGLASLANPDGWNLHFSILGSLGREAFRAWQEWSPPDFAGGGSAVAAFEAMLLLLLACAGLCRGLFRPHEAVFLVYLLHEALKALRHANLFAIAAAPVLARGLAELAERWGVREWRAFGWLWVPGVLSRSDPAWVAAAALAFVLFAASPASPMRRDLDGLHLSRGSAEFIERHFDLFGRAFNTDDIGGALIQRFWPKMRVFVDDRDFYSEAFLTGEYFPLRFGTARWRETFDRWQFSAAVVSKACPLVRLLDTHPGWRCAYQDARHAIFLPAAPGGPRAAAP